MVNLNLAQGTSAAEMVGYIQQQSETKTSPVLLEKLGDLQLLLQKPDLAVEAWEQALANNPTPQQRVRLLLARAEQLTKLGREIPSLVAWQDLAALLPPSPELARVKRQLEEAEVKLKPKK